MPETKITSTSDKGRDALLSLQNDGWEYVSTYKDERFIRVQKQKPLGERFENKVWLMLYGMGYSKMNRDDKFSHLL